MKKTLAVLATVGALAATSDGLGRVTINSTAPAISGTPTSGHCATWASSSSLGDAGGPCGSGGGGGVFVGQGAKFATVLQNVASASSYAGSGGSGTAVAAWSGTYVAAGGDVLVQAQITAYASTPGTYQYFLLRDGSVAATGSLFINASSTHITFPAVAARFAAESGSHVYSLNLGTSSALLTDGNDFATLTVMETQPGGGSAGAMKLIGRVVTTSGQSTVTFSGIPQNYSGLEVRAAATSSGAYTTTTDSLDVVLNGDTSANYDYSYNLVYNGAVCCGGTSGTATSLAAALFASGQVAPSFGVLDINDYANASTGHSVRSHSGANQSGGSFFSTYFGELRDVGAVTSLSITDAAHPYAAGSVFELYGIGGPGGSNSMVEIGAANWSGSSTSLTFSGIPQTYSNLELDCRMQDAVNAGADGLWLEFNGDATTADYYNSTYHGYLSTATPVLTSGTVAPGAGGFLGHVAAQPGGSTAVYSSLLAKVIGYSVSDANARDFSAAYQIVGGGRFENLDVAGGWLPPSAASIASITINAANAPTSASACQLYAY